MILDPLEIQAPRRRRRPALEARPALEQVRDPLRANLQHRADERAHHVPEERVGGDREVEVVAVALPRRLPDDPHEHLVLALGGREGRELVLAGKEGGRRLEALEVDGARPPERALRLERRARDAVENEVAVRASRGREARVEPLGRVLRVEHRHVGRQRRVERLGRLRGRRATRHLDARNLPVACTPVSVRPATASPSQPRG